MATNTPNLNLVKPAIDDYYDVGVFNGNMDTIDTAIQDLRDESASSVQSTGGTMTGPLEIETNGEGLKLKGERISYVGLYPEGEAAGRKGYYGFSETGNHDFLIGNEYSDGDVVFVQKGQRITLDELMNSGADATTDMTQHMANSDTHVTPEKKAEWDRSFMPRTASPGVTDLNQYTTTGFYQLGAASGYQNIPQGLDSTILEVKAHTGGYIIQRITSVTTQKSYFRTRTEQQNGWSQWIDASGGGGMSQIMIPTKTVKFSDTKEYTYTHVGTGSNSYMKLYTVQPNIKGTFKFSAEVAWDETIVGGTVNTLALFASSADGNNESNYRAGTDNQSVIYSFFTPVGTGIEDSTRVGDSIHGYPSNTYPVGQQSVAKGAYVKLEYNVSVTGDYPVSIYACAVINQNAPGRVLKARNITVSYDLV